MEMMYMVYCVSSTYVNLCAIPELVNVLNKSDVVTVSEGMFDVQLPGGFPKVYYPLSKS